MSLRRRFINELKSHDIHKKSACLVGLSGGGDSVALLSLIADVAGELNLTVYAARVCHGIRNELEEDSERHLCQNLCTRLHVPYQDIVLQRGEIPKMQKELGCGVEQAARTARLNLLHRHAMSLGTQILLLGHTADDQLETILMRLFSGSGPEGLKGIPMRREHIFRPLLCETRKELRKWLREKHIHWAEDSSNAKEPYRRNRIRNELIPLLSDIIPGWERAALTLAQRSWEVQKALNSLCEDIIPIEWHGKTGRWLEDNWDAAPDYLKAVTLWKLLNSLDESGIPDRRFSWSLITDIRSTLETRGKWQGLDVSICRETPYFVVKRSDEKLGEGRILIDNDISGDDCVQILGPWRVSMGFAPLSQSRAYLVGEENWPLILKLKGKSENPLVTLYSRGKIIQEQSGKHISHDSSRRMFYIQIMYKEEARYA